MANLNEIVETTPEYVNICGLKFKVEEFTMRTRAVWLEEVERYGLAELQRKVQEEVIPNVSSQVGGVQDHPHIKSLNTRFVKLTKKHEKLMELYGTDDEPEDIDEQLDAVVNRMNALAEELEEVAPDRVNQALEVTSEGRDIMMDFVQKQDEARMHFAWRLGKAAGKTDVDFDEFVAKAKPDDYDAAQKWVVVGNAGWVARMQNRKERRTAQKTQTGTSSTVKPSQPELNLTDLAN